LVTRVCPECGDPIEPGDWYDNETGECLDCVKMDDISVGYKGAKVIYKSE
jgi:NMD protein affecting ribosome stability and mRNA decay